MVFNVQPHFHDGIDVSLALHHQVLPNPLIHAGHLQVSVPHLNDFSIIVNKSKNYSDLTWSYQQAVEQMQGSHQVSIVNLVSIRYHSDTNLGLK